MWKKTKIFIILLLYIIGVILTLLVNDLHFSTYVSWYIIIVGTCSTLWIRKIWKDKEFN